MAAVQQAEGSLADNPFATIRDGRLHLKRPDALEVPERVKQIKRIIETSLPHVRIEDLLQEIDRLCGFTRELRPLSGYEPRVGNLYQTVLGALIAHGTNLGLVGMAHSVEGITVDMLQYVSQMFLTETTLKAASDIGRLSPLPRAQLYIWRRNCLFFRRATVWNSGQFTVGLLLSAIFWLL
jgi:hypothetical protein